MVITRKLSLQSQGDGDIINLTGDIARELEASDLENGTVTVFVTGSTAGVTTIEYEPGLVSDFQALWERIAPCNLSYEHNQRWGYGNGFSHVRASLLGPSLVIPFGDRKLLLGTWQQVILADFDNRPRSRQVVLQLVGE